MIDPQFLDLLSNNESDLNHWENDGMTVPYVTQMDTFDMNYYSNDPLSQSAQYQCPPVPMIQFIEPYIREDGTLVKGHFRTEADGFTVNNLKP